MSATPGMFVVTEAVTRVLEQRRAGASGPSQAGPWLLESPRLAPILAAALRVAAMPSAPVIVTGELGTGTADLAHWIHDHDATACTGRFTTMPGHLVGPLEARGRHLLRGTLFVDEIESVPPKGQLWLLKLASERGARTQPLRLVAGSKRSVADLLTLRHLNPELVHALDVSRLHIPSLRARPEEILLLASRFVSLFGERMQKPLKGLSSAAERKLMSYTYRANVRELRNVIERAVFLEDSDEVRASSIVFYSDAPSDAANDEAAGSNVSPLRQPLLGTEQRHPTLAQVERDYVVALIRDLRGSRAAMSRAMGVSYPTVLKKISRYGLDVRAIVAESDAATCSTV